MKETDQRFLHLEKKIGIFVFLALIGIVGVVVFIGIQQDVFTPKTRIYFITDSGKDLSEGLAVKLSGFRIGKVKSLSLGEDLKVKVKLYINKKYMRWVRTDSVAKLAKEGLIGDSVIEITPGKTGAEIEEHGMITFEKSKGLGEMAEDLKAEFQPVIEDIKGIIHYINDPQGDVKQTLGNINRLTADIPSTKQRIDLLLGDADKILLAASERINALLDSSKKTLSSTDEIIKKLDKGIPDMLDKTDKTLENVRKITENVHKVTEDIKKASELTAPRIPALVGKGGAIADDTKAIMDSVKKTWPISKHIEEPEEKTLKVDTYE